MTWDNLLCFKSWKKSLTVALPREIIINNACRPVSKVKQDQSAPRYTKPPLGYRTREGRKTRNRQRKLKRKEKRSKHRCSAFPLLLVNDITYLTRGTQVVLHLLFFLFFFCVSMCMCVSEQSCPASGVLDVDCNQGHMTLPQEVLQQRTGSRNTRTTSLDSLVPDLTANRSLWHSGNGCGCWCVHKCAEVLYSCIYVWSLQAGINDLFVYWV